MEAAKIDWKNIESVFVIDQVFENINAPKWVDFLASPSSSSSSSDDVAWFCRPDCKHPATAENFLKSTPSSSSSSKLLRSVSVSKLIGLADWTRKEPTLFKRRTPPIQDSENQNPNFSTPQSYHHHYTKSTDDFSGTDEKPRLKPANSAKDLFGGRDLFGKISDFCNELKKITRVRDKEDESPEEEEDQLSLHQGQGHLKLNPNHSYKPLGSVPVAALAPGLKDKENRMNDSDNKERKPLLQVKSEGALKTNAKPKLRRNMRDDEAENIPISLNLNNVKREAKVSPIRTNPPTPQGFSATRDLIKATPSKGTKSKLKEREILQELGQKKTLRDELDENIEKSENENASLVAAKEGRTLDVFWFLKPCTLSS